MFKQKLIKSIFHVEIPVSQQNDLEHFITVDWHKKNKNTRNFVIVEIKDFEIISKQVLV